MIKRTLVFSQPAYLSMRRDQLVVNYPDQDEVPKVVPIEDIGLILLEHGRITVTHRLIGRLLENKTAIITCDGKHLPSGLILPIVGHTLQSQRFQDQLSMSLPLMKQLWQQTIQAKITNQANHLREWNKEADRLDYWVRQVKSGDSNNCEALAAGYYWHNLFSEEVDGFTRSRDGEPPNNLLNYGYAILRAITARALISSGLFPTIGIHHKSQYNAYCLADDVMEPYRIYVDSIVRQLVEMDECMEELTREVKLKLLRIPVLDVIINDQKSPLMVAMSTTTSSLYECISGQRRKIKYPVYEPVSIFQT